MVIEVIIGSILLPFFMNLFNWLFRLLLIGVIGAKVKKQKDSLLEQVKDIKGAVKEHDNATSGNDW